MEKYRECREFARIPLYYDTYSDQKEVFYEDCERMMKEVNCSPINAVCGVLYHCYDETIDDNGMDRVALMIISFLFEMEHDCIDPRLAYAVNWHIEDFENGDYRDLFQEECYKQLMDDIEKVKKYLKEYFMIHPEALKSDIENVSNRWYHRKTVKQRCRNEECNEFERIPLGDKYMGLKEDFNRYCAEIMQFDIPCAQAVCDTFDRFFYEEIEMYGMDRVAIMVIGFLYEMKHEDIDPDLAYAVNWHIEDFEKGDYKDLFCRECYQQLINDITEVKKYLKEYFKLHPEVLED